MYKQKLEEQIKRFEALQDRCGVCDISKFIELSRNILSIAKKIDELEASAIETVLSLDGKKIHEEIRKGVKKMIKHK